MHFSFIDIPLENKRKSHFHEFLIFLMNKLEAKKEIKINSTKDCRNRLQKEKEKSPFKIVAEGLRLFMQYANVNLRECLCSILK